MFLPLLLKHPLTKHTPLQSFKRYTIWHLRKLLGKDNIIYPLINDTKIHLSRHDTAALVNYYSGLYEFEEMAFLLHFLREDDLFIDVGANIGVFSLLAAGEKKCRCVAFEPIPTTFHRLLANLSINGLEQLVSPFNIGLGSNNTTLKFTSNLESSVNRVAGEKDTDTIEVPVKRLDDVVPVSQNLESILLKVDVEGFETEVIKGADALLKNRLLKAIIIELNGSGEKFGYNEKAIKMKLEQEGFRLFYYHPFQRLLSQNPASQSWGNAIYIRDFAFVEERLTRANAIQMRGKTF